MSDPASRIRLADLRATPQRIAVLGTFAGVPSQTLAQVRERLGPSVRIDLVTLYRTLATFRDRGILHSIRIDGEERFFSCSESAEPHAHEANDVHVDYCRACGTIRERHGAHVHDDPDVVSCREERVLSRCRACERVSK